MDGSDLIISEGSSSTTVCLTGATGYIGSWLVHSLLRKGYAVHATARDPGKASHLLSSLGSNTRLKIFKANLDEEGSFDEALKGCVGLFHVAAPMVFIPSIKEENIEEYVQSEMIEPAVRGTINLLQACWRAKSVKRVIFTSSISTITGKEDNGCWRAVVDESSVLQVDVVWKTKPIGWVYILSKLYTEEAAFQFAREKGIDLVSIILPTVAGSFMTPSIPSSVQVLLSPITGDLLFYPILVSVHSRLGSFPFAHIEDICNAHIFLMEQSPAKGRYICAAGSCLLPQLIDLLSLEYPSLNPERPTEDFHDAVPPVISSNRLTELGFEFKYGLREIIKQTISCCIDHGLLKSPTNTGVRHLKGH